jgi:hypothetical protein
LVGGGGEAGVAPSATAAAGHEQALAVRQDLAQELVRLFVVDHRAERHRDFEVVAALARLVRALSVPAALRRVERGEAEMVEGVPVGVADQVDRSPIAPVAARGAAPRDELLPAERYTPVPSTSGTDVNRGFVEEDQGRFGKKSKSNYRGSRAECPAPGFTR